MTLKNRFALTFACYTAAVLALFGGTYYFSEGRAARRAQDESQLKILESLVSVCREASLAANGLAAINHLAALKKDPAVDFAFCSNPQGLIQAHSDPQKIGRPLSEADTGSPRVFKRQTEVLIGGLPVGVAQVGFRRDYLESQIRLQLWGTLSQLFAVGGVTFFLALIIALVLAWGLSRPIEKLAQAARAIGEGRLDHPIAVPKGGDELSSLALEMRDMGKKLKELNELKDEFIAGVSHDLRSPMAAVRMYIDFMLQIDKDRDKILPSHQKILVTIADSLTRLSIFVTNILDQAKMRAGRMEYYVKSAPLDPILHGLYALYAIVAHQQGVRLELNIPKDLPPALVDPERIEHVLSNLISNALKYTKAGGSITVSAAALEGGLIVTVADTGKGIPEDEIPNVFDKFHQVDEADQRAQRLRGTGLGLFIVKKAVEAMSGSISVRSQPGKGTTITLRLKSAGSMQDRNMPK